MSFLAIAYRLDRAAKMDFIRNRAKVEDDYRKKNKYEEFMNKYHSAYSKSLKRLGPGGPQNLSLQPKRKLPPQTYYRAPINSSGKPHSPLLISSQQIVFRTGEVLKKGLGAEKPHHVADAQQAVG